VGLNRDCGSADEEETTMNLDLATARALVDAVVAEATSRGLAISCSVADAQGLEVCTARMDGAPWFTPEVARVKARTSVALGRPSGDVADLAAEYPNLVELIGDQLPFRPTTLPGGIPFDGGAIAVSGAHPDDDVALARHAIATILHS
jgi:glc operon protein GlcG